MKNVTCPSGEVSSWTLRTSLSGFLGGSPGHSAQSRNVLKLAFPLETDLAIDLQERKACASPNYHPVPRTQWLKGTQTIPSNQSKFTEVFRSRLLESRTYIFLESRNWSDLIKQASEFIIAHTICSAWRFLILSFLYLFAFLPVLLPMHLPALII